MHFIFGVELHRGQKQVSTKSAICTTLLINFFQTSREVFHVGYFIVQTLLAANAYVPVLLSLGSG